MRGKNKMERYDAWFIFRIRLGHVRIGRDSPRARFDWRSCVQHRFYNR